MALLMPLVSMIGPCMVVTRPLSNQSRQIRIRSVKIQNKKSRSRQEYFPWGMTLFKSLAGTRCMDRWDEGGWDNDPYRHGRFTAIVERRENGFKKTKHTDALFAIPKNNYSVPDTMISIHHWRFLERDNV